MRKSRKRLGLVVLVLLAAALLSWFSGLTGLAVSRLVLPRLMPRDLGDGFVIERVTYDGHAPRIDRGGTLTISPDRLVALMEASVPSTRYLPPGTIRDGQVLQARWSPPDLELPGGESLVFLLHVSARQQGSPHLDMRYPADEFNQLFDENWSKSLDDREDWFLGHYDTTYRIEFDQLRLWSENPAPWGPVHALRYVFESSGHVRFKWIDNLARATIKAKVKELAGEIEIGVTREADRYLLEHEARLTVLDGNVNNLLPWGDDKVSERLRRALERSLNRGSMRRGLARAKVPLWAPLDTTVCFELTPVE